MASSHPPSGLGHSQSIAWVFFLPSLFLFLLLLLLSLLHFRRLLRHADIYVLALTGRIVISDFVILPLAAHFAIQSIRWTLIACQIFIWFMHTSFLVSMVLLPMLVIELILLMRSDGNSTCNGWPTRAIKGVGLAVIWTCIGIVTAVFPVFMWSESSMTDGVCPFLPQQLNHGYGIFIAVLGLTNMFFVTVCVIDSSVHAMAVNKFLYRRERAMKRWDQGNGGVKERSHNFFVQNWLVTIVSSACITLLCHVPVVIITLIGLAGSSADNQNLQESTIWFILFEALLWPLLLITISDRYRHGMVKIYDYIFRKSSSDDRCALERAARRQTTNVVGSPAHLESEIKPHSSRSANKYELEVEERIAQMSIKPRQASARVYPMLHQHSPTPALSAISEAIEDGPQPSAPVNIPLTPSDTQATVDSQSLTSERGDWPQEQPIAVSFVPRLASEPHSDNSSCSSEVQRVLREGHLNQAVIRPERDSPVPPDFRNTELHVVEISSEESAIDLDAVLPEDTPEQEYYETTLDDLSEEARPDLEREAYPQSSGEPVCDSGVMFENFEKLDNNFDELNETNTLKIRESHDSQTPVDDSSNHHTFGIHSSFSDDGKGNAYVAEGLYPSLFPDTEGKNQHKPNSEDEQGAFTSSPLGDLEDGEGAATSSPFGDLEDGEGAFTSSPFGYLEDGQGAATSSPFGDLEDGQGAATSSPFGYLEDEQGAATSSPFGDLEDGEGAATSSPFGDLEDEQGAFTSSPFGDLEDEERAFTSSPFGDLEDEQRAFTTNPFGDLEDQPMAMENQTSDFSVPHDDGFFEAIPPPQTSELLRAEDPFAMRDQGECDTHNDPDKVLLEGPKSIGSGFMGDVESVLSEDCFVQKPAMKLKEADPFPDHQSQEGNVFVFPSNTSNTNVEVSPFEVSPPPPEFASSTPLSDPFDLPHDELFNLGNGTDPFAVSESREGHRSPSITSFSVADLPNLPPPPEWSQDFQFPAAPPNPVIEVIRPSPAHSSQLAPSPVITEVRGVHPMSPSPLLVTDDGSMTDVEGKEDRGSVSSAFWLSDEEIDNTTLATGTDNGVLNKV